MLKRLKEQGITILVSTPYMDEAALCDRIALMQSGKILAVDTPEAIVDQYPERLYAAGSSDIPRLLLDIRKFPNIRSCFTFGEYLHLSFKDEFPEAAEALEHYLLDRGHHNVVIKTVVPTIEDCFIRLLSPA